MQNFASSLISNFLAAGATHIWLKTYDPVPLKIVLAALISVPLIFKYTINIIIPSSNFSLPLAYSSFYLALTASVCAYRLSPLHPLSKYPGPVILKITKLWGAWVAYQGKTHIYVKQLHDYYGPTVRIGPNELSTTEKELIPQILGNQGMPKGPLWDGRRFGNAGDSKGYDTVVDLRDSVLHSHLRLPWNKAFAAEPMRDYEELLIPRIVELNIRLKEACKGGIARLDIARWIACFTYDFMGDLAFSGDFQLMASGDSQGYLQMMDEALYFMSITQHLPWIATFVRSLPIVNRGVTKFINHGVENSLKRSQMELKRKDLFYHMAEASGQSSSDLSLIVTNSLLTIVAGSDTTASVLSNSIYLLLSHPKAYKILQQEVDAAFVEYEVELDTPCSVGDEMHGSKMYNEIFGSLKYLNAVINETLRLFPAVPTSLQRAPAKGASSKILRKSDGIILLREGNAINVPPYALHRDPRYFSPHPDAFIPERWLSLTDTEYRTSRDAFVPFSVGPQNCAGRSLALVEMRYVLAILVRNFEMHFDAPTYDSARWLQDLKDQFTLQKGHLWIRITQRR